MMISADRVGETCFSPEDPRKLKIEVWAFRGIAGLISWSVQSPGS